MSRGVAIWSMCCLAFWIFIGLFTVFPFLFEGEIISALFGVVMVCWGYLITFPGGVIALNVFGVIGEVVDVNVRESRAIRGKE
jgi:hypothetical protein